MKTKDKIELIKKTFKESYINPNNYKIWVVGTSKTIHVTCVNSITKRLNYLIDNLIRKYGGIRYCNNLHSIGIIRKFSETTFCFKIN